MAQLLRNPKTVAPEPSAATVSPQPRPATAAPNTRGSPRPGRGHDGTMESPAAQREPSVDRDTHHVTSPTPTPETFPPGVTPLPAPPTSPTSVAPGLANPCVTQLTTTPGSTAAGSRDTTHPNAKNPVEKEKGKPKQTHLTQNGPPSLRTRFLLHPGVGEVAEGIAKLHFSYYSHHVFSTPQISLILDTFFLLGVCSSYIFVGCCHLYNSNQTQAQLLFATFYNFLPLGNRALAYRVSSLALRGCVGLFTRL